MPTPQDPSALILFPGPIDKSLTRDLGYEQSVLRWQLEQYITEAGPSSGLCDAGYRAPLLAAVLVDGGIRRSEAPVRVSRRYPHVELDAQKVDLAFAAVAANIESVRGRQPITVPVHPYNHAVSERHLAFLRQKRADYQARQSSYGTRDQHDSNSFRIFLIDILLERGYVDPVSARAAFDTARMNASATRVVACISDAAAKDATQVVRDHAVIGEQVVGM